MMTSENAAGDEAAAAMLNLCCTRKMHLHG